MSPQCILKNVIFYLNSNFFNASASFANVDINQSIVDESSQNCSHSLPETDSSTMNLSIATCDISKENEVSNLVDQITSPNLLFEVKKLIRRVSEIGILIGNLNINSLLNKLERVKDIFMQYIDILVWTVTKLDDTFPTAQFLVT